MANKDTLRGHQLERLIIFRDVPITVEFTLYKGWEATEDEPGEQDYLDIERVMVDEINILNLIGNRTYGEIAGEIYNLLEKEGKE